MIRFHQIVSKFSSSFGQGQSRKGAVYCKQTGQSNKSSLRFSQLKKWIYHYVMIINTILHSSLFIKIGFDIE